MLENNATLFCKTLSSVWIEKDYVLSQVVSFLVLSDAVKLMSALNHCPKLIGDAVVVAPTTKLIKEMIRRAVSIDIKVDAKTLRWAHLGENAEQHSQHVTLSELRMLHHLFKSIPGDLLLVNGRSSLDEIGHEYGAEGSCDLLAVAANAEPEEILTCVLSARINSKSVALTLDCKRCSEESCACIVLRTCPACNEICSSCVREDHAQLCDVCDENVCPSCILPEGEEVEAVSLCTECGFCCFICDQTLRNEQMFLCSAGKNCATQQLVCDNCAFQPNGFEIISCDRCNETWCEGCMALHVCQYCQQDYCSECNMMRKCILCERESDDCDNDSRSCGNCYATCCDGCDGLFACSNDCGEEFCGICRDEKMVACALGHLTCKPCIKRVPAECAAMEGEWGDAVEDKSCRQCWADAYAVLKGYDHGDDLLTSICSESSSLNDALEGSLLLQKSVQYWWLGGRHYQDTKRFDTCSFLPKQLASMSAADKDDAQVVNELVASLALTHVFVSSSSAAFVNRIGCLDFHIPRNESINTISISGQHGNPTTSTLALEAGERIVSVHHRRGDVIDSLRLVTSAGREETFGGPGGGEPTNYRVPAGWRLVGFFGGVGGHLHSLGVVIAKDPPP